MNGFGDDRLHQQLVEEIPALCHLLVAKEGTKSQLCSASKSKGMDKEKALSLSLKKSQSPSANKPPPK